MAWAPSAALSQSGDAVVVVVGGEGREHLALLAGAEGGFAPCELLEGFGQGHAERADAVDARFDLRRCGGAGHGPR